jgi:hypothetical protein
MASESGLLGAGKWAGGDLRNRRRWYHDRPPLKRWTASGSGGAPVAGSSGIPSPGANTRHFPGRALRAKTLNAVLPSAARRDMSGVNAAIASGVSSLDIDVVRAVGVKVDGQPRFRHRAGLGTSSGGRTEPVPVRARNDASEHLRWAVLRGGCRSPRQMGRRPRFSARVMEPGSRDRTQGVRCGRVVGVSGVRLGTLTTAAGKMTISRATPRCETCQTATPA